jgi:hypothetical protein
MDLVIADNLTKDKSGSTGPSLSTEKSVLNRKLLIQKQGGAQNEPQYNPVEDDYLKKQLAVQNLIKTANAKLNLYINNENVKKTEPMWVEVYMIFLRVGEVRYERKLLNFANQSSSII